MHKEKQVKSMYFYKFLWIVLMHVVITRIKKLSTPNTCRDLPAPPSINNPPLKDNRILTSAIYSIFAFPSNFYVET